MRVNLGSGSCSGRLALKLHGALSGTDLGLWSGGVAVRVALG